MKARKSKKIKKVRAVVYLPPSIYQWLRETADGDGMTASQKGAKIIIDEASRCQN